MKFNQIREMAQRNQFTVFFKQLYRHCLDLLESIPEEELAKIFAIKSYTSCFGGTYSSTGLIDGFIFKNHTESPDDKIGIRHIDKIDMIVEQWYSDNSIDLGTEKGCCFESSFDFRHLTIKFLFTRNMVYFERDLDEENYKFDTTDEDHSLLMALCEECFLESLFGEHFIKFDPWDLQDNYTGFYVSTEFFKEP